MAIFELLCANFRKFSDVRGLCPRTPSDANHLTMTSLSEPKSYRRHCKSYYLDFIIEFLILHISFIFTNKAPRLEFYLNFSGILDLLYISYHGPVVFKYVRRFIAICKFIIIIDSIEWLSRASNIKRTPFNIQKPF